MANKRLGWPYVANQQWEEIHLHQVKIRNYTERIKNLMAGRNDNVSLQVLNLVEKIDTEASDIKGALFEAKTLYPCGDRESKGESDQES